MKMRSHVAWLGKVLMTVLCAGLCTTQARASDDASDAQRYQGPVRYDLSLTPQDAFQRTQNVLNHFGVPAETETQSQIDAYQNAQTLEGLQELLPFFDPSSEFLKFSTVNSSRLDAFQDIQSLQITDFSANLRSSSEAEPKDSFVLHLAAAQLNSADLPLQGLRIALDPGHMGSDSWDSITGKWVADPQGHKLSEGVINLQTAMLLEQQLLALGAQTMITHRGLRPVTDGDYKSFDIHAAGLVSLREQSLDSWFTGLLSVAPDGDDLFNAFENDADFKGIFAEKNRGLLYNDSDLQARVDAIRAFQPDITLIIHYDAAVHTISPGPAFSHDATKVYVPGAFAPSELASRNDRMELASHLLDEAPWRASVALAHEVVTTLSANLKIPFDKYSPGNVKQIEPGMFSRNLYLLKRHYQTAVAYVECAFYNDSGEFAAMTNATHPMLIDGQSYPYSDRNLLVATSLKQAVLQFVKKGF